MGKTYLSEAINLAVIAIVFLVLFVVFLIKSIRRGRQIRELEKKLRDINTHNGNIQTPYMPMYVPQFVPYQQVNTVQPQMTQSVADALMNSCGTPAAVSTAQNTASPVMTMPQTPSGPVFQPSAVSGSQSAAPVSQPSVAASYAAPVQPAVSVQSSRVTTPSWAVSPAAVQEQRNQTSPVLNRNEEKHGREKFFSSINITFGIGVLLLTIVGATFMTGSWSWMTEEIRAISLVAIVFMVYGMSFLAGKVLKLQQTGFALYSLASLLGPIVIVGMGIFNLLGSAFSFKDGSGWLVATVASTVLLISAVGGRFLFRENNQANIYRGTTYISLTWLVIFLAGQIGQASEAVNEWSMICLGLATLALAFRIVSMTKLLEGETFFRVYSEIITYIPAAILTVSIFEADGAVFAAAIVEFIVFVLFAKFTEKREWAKYLTPLVGMEIVFSWIVFGDVDDAYLLTSVTMLIIFVLFAVHKAFKISTALSDIGLPVALGTITSFIALEEVPVMGAAASFLTLAIIVFELVGEPMLAKSRSVPEGLFRKEVSAAMQLALSVIGAVFYYTGAVMVYITPEKNLLPGNFYFTLAALIPAVAAVVLRIVCKEDIRVKASGLTMAIFAVTSGFFSLFSYQKGLSGSVFCSHLYVCAWILVLTVMVLSAFLTIRPLKEKKLSAGSMFWIPVFVNSPAIGVFLMIEYNQQVVWRLKDIPISMLDMFRQISTVSFLFINAAALVVMFFLKRKGKETAAKYAEGLKYFFCGFAMNWFAASWIILDSSWKMLIVAAVFAVILYFFDCGLFAVLPVIAAEFSIMEEILNIENHDLCNVLLIALALAVAAGGRLFFRKNVFDKKRVDYLSLTSFIFLFGLNGADYTAMMVFLALSLLVLNLSLRVKVPVRVLVSVFASLVCMGIVAQPFIDYPDVILLEINLVLMLGTLFVICRFIRPASDGVLRYIWFTGVSLCLIAEGVSAAVTGEVLDLILVGTASFGIFIYAFIRRNRLWFILGVISMISIAVYLSVAFWSSLVWLIYLFLAGSILVVMAAVNEWGKRHNKDGTKKRFFEEWTW